MGESIHEHLTYATKLGLKAAKISQLEKELREERERNRLLAEALGEYGNHNRECILSFFEAGEPTKDGGYRTKIKGKWYQTKPVDKTPKCTCGLEEALREYGE